MSERSVSPYEKYGAANPFTDASLRIHSFSATDSLSGLAYKYYGDWELWRVIAERNKIRDPRQVEIGTQLIIPQLPLKKGEYEL